MTRHRDAPAPRIGTLVEGLLQLAEATAFSGVIRVAVGEEIAFHDAFGFSDRAHRIPMAVDSQLAIASGVKGITALTVMRLIEEGALALSTTARSLLGRDLPLIDNAVTVEHLLSHWSGVGDYIDEDADPDLDDYLLPVPVHELASTEQYLPVLDGHPQKFTPGHRFSYSNSGYVVLALLAERASGTPFPELVSSVVCGPAGMRDTAFLRSDELPARAAPGYLHRDGLRTNVFHLPVQGSGDGGIYTTAADIHAFWEALFADRIVAAGSRALLLSARSQVASGMRYGLGFWLAPSGPAVLLEGADTGVSFRSMYNPSTTVTYSVLANTTDGAWPIVQLLDAELLAAAERQK
jgi:CubicO group peptidase (beta-lactamase class C family)